MQIPVMMYKPPMYLQKKVKCPRVLIGKLYTKGIKIGYSLAQLDNFMSARCGLFTWFDGEELWRFFHES